MAVGTKVEKNNSLVKKIEKGSCESQSQGKPVNSHMPDKHHRSEHLTKFVCFAI